MTHHVLLLGAGKIGTAIAKFLSHSGDYDIVVGDVDERSLARVHGTPNVHCIKLDSSSQPEIELAMRDRHSVLSALNFSFNPTVARAALNSGVSYFDLTEDVATTRTVKMISAEARPGQIFMPQCGLAPGFVSIAAYHLAKQFDKLDAVRLRVGALPQ